jgi:hypothetical protein
MSIAKFSVMGSEDTFSAACYDIANEGRMTMLLVLAQPIVIVGLLIEICIVRLPCIVPAASAAAAAGCELRWVSPCVHAQGGPRDAHLGQA